MNIIGIDLGGTNVRAGLINNNVISKVVSRKINAQGSVEEVLNDIFCLVEELSAGNSIEGVGVGVPSVVDVKKGIVYDVQNIPSWKEVPLKYIAEEKYHIPFYINNDANCFAAGEKYFGKAKQYENAVGLIVGTGLGAGLIINGRLYSGTNCGAGEFGMIPYKSSNYESYCSGQFFKSKYNISGEEIFEKAEKGDEGALRIFSEFGENLGDAIRMILYSIDPEIVILGGSVSRAYNFFKESMWRSVNTFAYSNSIKKLVIEPSNLEQIAILGAAALFYDATKL